MTNQGEVVLEMSESVETVNIDETDLFPHQVVPESEVSSMDNHDSIRSDIVESIIRQHSNDVNFQREFMIVSDRLYFTKLYRSFLKMEEDSTMTDFEKYNKEVMMEALLKDKFIEKLRNEEVVLKTSIGDNVVPGDEQRPVENRNFFKKFVKNSPVALADGLESSRTSIIDKSFTQQQVEEKSPTYTTMRKLKSRHLQMIGFSSTIGVGLFLNSGKLFEIAGPLGCLLGYVIGGIIVLCTMLNFCEMVTLIPLSDGISGVTSRFIDDAFGFSLGLCYWISFGLGLPTEIIAGTIMLSYYSKLDVPDGDATVGWIFLFLVLVIVINLMDVRVYLEFEFCLNIIKILFTVLIIIFLIVSNRGGASPDHKFVGFKYWDAGKSTELLTFGPFRPTFDLKDEGEGSRRGILGNTGRFLSVITASLISCYSYNGTEIPCIVAGEVINPRHALKRASKQVFWRISLFYILSLFIIGINIYSGDPRLLRYVSDQSGILKGSDIRNNAIVNEIGGQNCYNSNIWSAKNNGNQSPWVLAIQYTNNCNLASVLNGLIIVFAISSSSSHLYVSSRSLYAMAAQGKAPTYLTKCWSNGVPYLSILTTSLFGFLSFLALNSRDLEIFQVLINLISTSAILTWFGINFAYLRFYYALQKRSDIISRNDPHYPYLAPCQPYLAYVGLCGSFIVLILMGFITFLKNQWNTEFFLTSYGMWIIFIGSYMIYKFMRNVKYQKLYNIDLDTGRVDVNLE